MVNDKNGLELLMQEVFHLKIEWDCFRQLFMRSDERSKILFDWMPDLANTLKISIAYNTVSALCRLTDEKDDTYTLLTMAHEQHDNQEIQRKMGELVNATRIIRKFRNKQVAHLDDKVVLGTKSVTVPEVGEIDKAVRIAEELVVSLDMTINDRFSDFSNASVEHNVRWLVACLAYGAEHDGEVIKIKRKWDQE